MISLPNMPAILILSSNEKCMPIRSLKFLWVTQNPISRHHLTSSANYFLYYPKFSPS